MEPEVEPTEVVSRLLTSLEEPQLTSEDHYAINIDLAWKMLNKYYLVLDNTPIYVAAIILHPCQKWRWLESHWKEHPEWLSKARKSFIELSDRYRYHKPKNWSYPPPHKRRRLETPVPDVTKDWPSSEDDDEPPDIDMQMALYRRDSSYRHLLINDARMDVDTSPIQYWLGKRSEWPQLAAMALDIYAIPVMSDEPERVFSMTGAVVTPRRRSLLDDTIAHLMVVKAWIQSNLIKLDR